MHSAVCRGYVVGAGGVSARPVHDARACPFLRRAGPEQERGQHHDDELRGDGGDRRAMDSLRLRARLRPLAGGRGRLGQLALRALGHRPPPAVRRQGGPHPGVRDVPGEVRDHHPGPHQRCGCRADEVLVVRVVRHVHAVVGDRVIELDLRMSVDAGESVDEIWIEGTPSIHSITKGVHGDLSTAAVAVNAIRRVIAAAPGLITMAP